MNLARLAKLEITEEKLLYRKMKMRWSIAVSGNWRITFEFRDGNTYLLDYEDYH